MRVSGTRVALCALLLASSACTTSRSVLVGQARPALSPEQVQIYTEPPASHYDEIANIYASSRGSFARGAAAKIDKVMERLKIEAAKVGANGVLMHGVGGEASGALGGGISTNTGRSPYIDAVGGSVLLHQEAGDGVAIYVAAH